MKKIFCILLALSLLLSASAFAEDADGGNMTDSMPGGTPPDGTPPDGFGGGTPPGGGTSSFEYAAVTEITESAELTDETYVSEEADVSALIINTDGEVTVSGMMVRKTGDSDGGDNCNFYGLNAGVLVMGGSTAVISGGTVETHASGANGVFSYGGNGGKNGASGDGTTVIISGTSAKHCNYHAYRH